MRWRLVRFVVALATALAALAIVLVWLLGRGPIRLAILDRPIATALGSLGPDLRAEVGGTELVRAGRGVAFRVQGLRLLRRDGTPLLVLPEVAVRPRLRPLLRGRFEVGGLRLSDVQLALTRTADGELRLGTGEGDAGVALGTLLGASATPTGSERPPPRFVLERARVTFDDRLARKQAALSDASLTITPEAGRLHAAFGGTLELASETPPFRGAVTLAVSAQASATIAPAGRLGTTTFTLASDDGSLVPPAGGDPLALGRVVVEGTYDPEASSLALTRLTADLGGSRLDGTTTTRLGATATLAADATVDALAVETLTRLWPAELAATARSWVAENVHTGTLERCRIRLAFRGPAAEAGEPAALSAPGAGADTLDVACDFTGVDADYLPPLEPIRAGAGKAHLTAERLLVELASGTAGACQVEGSTFGLDFAVDPPQATITAEVSGASADVLALVDRPPLGVGALIGIAPKDLGGQSRVHAELELPLKADLRRHEIVVTATAALEDASVPELVAGLGIEHGRLDVRVDGGRLEVKGRTAVTGLADVTAPVDVELAIAPGATPAVREARLVVDGDGVTLKGTATFADSRVTAATLERVRLGGHDLAGTLQRGRSGDYVVILDGARLDLASLLASAGDTNTTERAAALDARYVVAVQLGRVRMRPEVELHDVRGTVRAVAGRIDALDLTASLAPGNLRATLAAGRLIITSDRADRALGAVGFKQFTGGTLALAATTDRRGPLAVLDGELTVKDFKVVRAPVLAKVLAVGSLGGMASLIQGEGLSTKEARFPFHWENQRLTLHDVRAIGTIGLTADGTIDLGRRTCDVRGNVIPAYTLNTALGRVPWLGKIMGADQGIVGIGYSVTGGIDDPTVFVNPLTAVTPGILRTWFVDPFARRGQDRSR